ncbi:MAG TPA: hypothetical protein DEP46_13920 [Blastocatellia bacterium]|nr:hypothetical protein [Blastocatellia bacterium]
MSSTISRLKTLIPVEIRRGLHRARNRFILGLRFNDGIERLNLGCGDNLLDGWANVDFGGSPGVIEHDLTKPIPLPSGSIQFIFTEHFIEHINREQAQAFLQDCFRLLKKGGVLRISTPNLRRIVDDYLKGPQPEWSDWEWSPETACQMVNGAMRLWGHQFIYDHEELEILLKEAKFDRVERKGWGESDFSDLRGLETREYFDDVIVEAIKGEIEALTK